MRLHLANTKKKKKVIWYVTIGTTGHVISMRLLAFYGAVMAASVFPEFRFMTKRMNIFQVDTCLRFSPCRLFFRTTFFRFLPFAFAFVFPFFLFVQGSPRLHNASSLNQLNHLERKFLPHSFSYPSDARLFSILSCAPTRRSFNTQAVYYRDSLAF